MTNQTYHRLTINALRVYLSLAACIYAIAVMYCISTEHFLALALVAGGIVAISSITLALFGKKPKEEFGVSSHHAVA